MKKILLMASAIIVAYGCTNGADTPAAGSDTSKMADIKTTKLPEMAYALNRPYAHWQTGDPQHAVTVMKGLKAFETGDINASMEAFGDSVKVGFDYYQAKLSKDSLKVVLTYNRSMSSNISIKMSDWESVISADKKEEWVTLWYKEFQTDKSGHTDSLAVVDDLKIVNGKIVELDEKIQHLGPPKK